MWPFALCPLPFPFTIYDSRFTDDRPLLLASFRIPQFAMERRLCLAKAEEPERNSHVREGVVASISHYA